MYVFSFVKFLYFLYQFSSSFERVFSSFFEIASPIERSVCPAFVSGRRVSFLCTILSWWKCEICFKVGFPRGQQETFSNMSGVKYANDFLRKDVQTFSDLRFIQNFLHPVSTSAKSLLEIRDGLSLPDMFVPDFPRQLLRSSFVLKLFVTGETSVMLQTSPFSIPLYPPVFTEWALFLYMLCNG